MMSVVLKATNTIFVHQNSVTEPGARLPVVHISCSGSKLTAEKPMNGNTVQNATKR